MSAKAPDVIFHRYFSRLPQHWREVYRGRLNISKFEILDLANAFESIRDQINSRWLAYADRIQAPNGKVNLHLDYIDSQVVNAITFSDEEIHFVGITDKMLVHLSRTSGAIWRLNVLNKLLGVDLSQEVRDFLFQAVLLIQLQFISSHELGHLFHGHVDPSAFSEEFTSHTEEASQLSDQLRPQSREVEADGYAVHLLLDNMITSGSGSFIHGRLGSTLSVEDCTLTLLLLSVGALFFFLRPREFSRGGRNSGLVLSFRCARISS